MNAIYCLRDSVGVVRYVGMTTKLLPERLDKHLEEARGSARTHKLNWLRSLPAPPTIEIIEWVPPLDWRGRERYWIALFREHGHRLVNGTDGGDGVELTPEAHAKMCAAQLGRRCSVETREKLRQSNVGKTHSLETRAKMRAAQLGKSRSAETRAKMRANQLGKKLSAETCEKLRRISTGKKYSLETRAKVSAGNRGKIRTPEMRARYGAAQRRRWKLRRESHAS